MIQLTVNGMLNILKSVPMRDRDRPVSICGSAIRDGKTVDYFGMSWIDCSDAILLIINEDECENNSTDNGERTTEP